MIPKAAQQERHHTFLRGSSTCSFNELPDCWGRQGSRLSSHFPAAFEYSQGWNRADPESLRQPRQLVGIHLRNKPPAGAFGSYFFQLGSDHLARAAPRGPEVDEHRNRRPAGYRVKHRVALHLDRFSRWRQFGATLTATKSLSQAFIVHSVSLAALRASQHHTELIGFY